MNTAKFISDRYEHDPAVALTIAIAEAHAGLNLEPGLRAALESATIQTDDAPDSVEWRIEVALRIFVPETA